LDILISLKTVNSKDSVIKWNWLPFTTIINLDEITKENIINMIYNLNIISLLLIFFLFTIIYRYRNNILIFLNEIKENFSVNKYIYLDILNRSFILRYILFGSFFLFYFIYYYISLNLDIKDILKTFEEVFTKDNMFINHLSSKFGFDIYSTNPPKHIDYASNVGNESQPKSPNGTNNDTGNLNNSRSVSPVNIDTGKLPRKISWSKYFTDDECGESECDIDEDPILTNAYDDKSDDELKEHRKTKKAKYDDPQNAEDFNTEFSETNHILEKLKSKRSNYKSSILERIEHHNYRVDDIKESLSNAEIKKKKVDYTKVNNILNNDSSNKTLKRTHDMMNDRDQGYTADNESEIHFTDKRTKEKFLSDLSSTKKDSKVINALLKKYESTKSTIDGAYARFSHEQNESTFNQVGDMRDSLPNTEKNKNGSKNK